MSDDKSPHRSDFSDFRKADYFKLIYENAIEGIYLRELNGPIISLNPAMVRMFGYDSEKEMTAKTTAKQTYVDQDQYKKVLEILEETGEIVGFEIELKRKDGTHFWGQLTARTFIHKETGIPLLEGSILDITEKKLSEEQYRHLLDVSPDAVVVYGLKGELLYANPAFTDVYGWTFEEWKGKKVDFVPEDKIKEAYSGVQRALSGETFEFETQRYHKEGRLLEVHLKVAPYRDPFGNIIGMYVIHRDITKTKQIEENFKHLFNSINDGVLTHDLEGRIYSINPAGAKGLGSTQEKLIGKQFTEFLTDRYKKLFHEEYIPQILRTGKYKGMLMMNRPDGTEHYVEFNAVLKSGMNGKELISGIGRFVTDRILAEKELIMVKDQLIQAQKLEAMSALTRGISRDFNNLLQTIIQPIQMARQSETLDPENMRYLDMAEISASRGAELVRQLMTFSRRVEPRFETADLSEIVDLAVGELIKNVPDSVRLQTRHGENMAPVSIDTAQVRQVILNLGQNAFDAMPEGGALIFETRQVKLTTPWPFPNVPPGTYTVLDVSDTGTGIPEKLKAKIFEPFFSTKKPGQGTGLGLSMVYGITQAHKAHITCHSEPGKGSTFSLFFPAAQPDMALPDLDVKKIDKIQDRTRTILLIEDEDYIREIVNQVLTMAGCEVLEALDGKEALTIYSQKGVDIDAVVLDISMPGVDGEACMKELLNYDSYVKLILITASIDLDTIEFLQEKGAKGIVKKPFTSAELLREVNRVLKPVHT